MNKLKTLLRKVVVALSVSAFAAAHAVEVVSYYHNDISGSPILATDASGNVLWKENYRPYGDKLNKQAASAGNKIGFHGKPYDDNTGLSYMGARYCDPLLGRFTGIDPVEVNLDNIHAFNRYAYANNNPYRFVDPDGREAEPYDALGNAQTDKATDFKAQLYIKAVGVAAITTLSLGAVVSAEALGVGAVASKGAGNAVKDVASGAARTNGEIGKAVGWTNNANNSGNLAKEVAVKNFMNAGDVKKLADSGFTKQQFEKVADKLKDSLGIESKQKNVLIENRIEHLEKIVNLWPK
jgi:RHS repeat-associated protein